MNIFATLTQGDSAKWDDDPFTLSDGRTASYAGGWTLTWHLRGPSQLDLVAGAPTGNTTGWHTTLTAAGSAALAAGVYAWVATLTSGTERLTAGQGQLTIAQDITALSTTFDPRSPAQIALANCEAAMATFNATGGKVKKYEIAGRTMEFQTIGDLMQLHSYWAIKVRNEKAANDIAQGLGNPRNLYIRHVRPQ
jgi:hypothetical protein